MHLTDTCNYSFQSITEIISYRRSFLWVALKCSLMPRSNSYNIYVLFRDKKTNSIDFKPLTMQQAIQLSEINAIFLFYFENFLSQFISLFFSFPPPPDGCYYSGFWISFMEDRQRLAIFHTLKLKKFSNHQRNHFYQSIHICS